MASSPPSPPPLNQEVDPATLPALFDPVMTVQAVYKTIESYNIVTSILIPKTLLGSDDAPKPAKAPVLLRYHGGGMITSSGLQPGIFAPWSIELAVRHGAVIVLPNFRLLPEATIQDQLVDVEDHFRWMHTHLAAFLEEHTSGRVVPDLDRVLVSGDSAGGYNALMQALDHPTEIRAVAVSYPMADMRSPHFVEDYDKPLLGTRPQMPRSDYEEHMARVRAGESPSAVWADAGMERIALMTVMIQRGIFADFFPPATTAQARAILPLARIQDGGELPRGGVAVWHGTGDTVVPTEGSVKLKEVIERADPGLEVRIALREGNHGFDIVPVPARLGEAWFEEVLGGVVAAWLA